MAKMGLKHLKYSHLTENSDGSASYDGAKSFAKAIDCKVSIEKNSAELYADDNLAESDYTFKKGTVSATVDEDDDSVFADVLGHEITEEYTATSDTTPTSGKTYYTKSGNTYSKFTGSTFTASTTYYEKSATSGEVVRRDTDIAPYVGFGRIITKLVDGKYKYKVEFLYKVKFSEPNQEDATKGESVEFKTPSVEGAVHKLPNGKWSISKTFSTMEEAETYLDNLMKQAS